MFLFSCHCGTQNQSEDWIKKQQFNCNSNLSFTERNPQIQPKRCHFNDRNVLTRFMFLVMFVFAPFSLMTRVSVLMIISSVSRDSFDETIRRSKAGKHCCGDRKTWYGGYHGRPKKLSGSPDLPHRRRRPCLIL